nr:hypothetical protein [Tanacetum cinerariifolium]
ISQTKAEEAKAARKVHATHARVVTKSIHKSAKKKSGGKSSKGVVIQDTLSTPKSKPATSKTKLKGAPSLTSQEQEAANIMQALKENSEFSDDDNDDVGKDDEEGNVNDEGDDHVSDTQDADDEDDETESDEDEIYKYKIGVRKDEDIEIKDAEDGESDKGEEKVNDAAKEEVEKTSKAKDDAKKTELPPSIKLKLICIFRVLDFRVDYKKEMPKRKWTAVDQKRSSLMIELIDKQMREREIIRNLERLDMACSYVLISFLSCDQSVFPERHFLIISTTVSMASAYDPQTCWCAYLVDLVAKINEKEEFIRISVLNLLDGVPELLHKDFQDICRYSESLEMLHPQTRPGRNTCPEA